MTQARDVPVSWPWKGVSIENIDFNPVDLNKIVKKININSIQLRLKPRRLAQLKKISTTEAWKATLRWGDQMLDQCQQLGIGAVISLEGFPIDPETGYTQISPKFWKNDNDLKKVVSLADTLANHYATRGNELLAYQLLSEPVIKYKNRSIRPSKWHPLSYKIVAAIRRHDPDRWIAIAPGPWGMPSSYTDYTPLNFEKIIYGAHAYVPHAFTHQGIKQWEKTYTYPGRIANRYWDKTALIKSMKALRQFQLKHDVPVWIGEFSAIRWADGSEQYLKDLVSIFNEYKWSWTYFTINGWHGWMPDYNQQYGMKKKGDKGYLSIESQYVGFNSVRWKTLIELFEM